VNRRFMSAYTKAAQTMFGGETSQREAIPGRETEMAANNAGGFSFLLDDWKRLERFLIMGSEGGTYYVTEPKLTLDNVKAVLKCIAEDGIRVVNKTVEISQDGRALKNTPALFVIALCASYKADNKSDQKAKETRTAAYNALPLVARTGTHLFQFNNILNEMKRGWGKGRRRAIAAWYNDKSAKDLVYQVLKYREREGLNHKRLLNTAHPKPASDSHSAVYKWIQDGALAEISDEPISDEALQRIWAFERVKKATNISDVVKLVREYELTQEMVPTNWHGEKALWEALIEKMPMTALIRNLGRLTSNGVITSMSDTSRKVQSQITDAAWLKKARIHPMTLLIALKTYQSGHGVKGSLSWSPVSKVVDALDTGFYAAFGAVEPTNKNILLGLDVSGSMTSPVSGVPYLSCMEASAAFALVTYATEPNCELMAFGNKFVPISISNKMRLDAVIKEMRKISFGGTDCALPMQYARGLQSSSSTGWGRPSSYEKRTGAKLLEVDAFAVFTDSETWAGAIQPVQALQAYRKESGRAAKLIVAGMASTGFTIADPQDSGMIDIVGMDANVPQFISDFIRN
jgi:60 kDa SS-A/Ro ribonucleoprotein